MNKEEIQLDVIPIYKNEMYPTKDMIGHFKADIKTGTDREYLLKRMIEEIKYKFSDYNAVIILEKGMVIEVLWIKKQKFY